MRRKGTLPQRTKVVQPATKQSTGLFLPNLKQIWSSLSLVRVNKIAKEKPIRISVSAFFGSPSWTRTNDPFGQKHSRLARLERFAILLVSSYSTDQLFVHRTVDPSRQLTAACSAN